MRRAGGKWIGFFLYCFSFSVSLKFLLYYNHIIAFRSALILLILGNWGYQGLSIPNYAQWSQSIPGCFSKICGLWLERLPCFLEKIEFLQSIQNVLTVLWNTGFLKRCHETSQSVSFSHSVSVKVITRDVVQRWLLRNHGDSSHGHGKYGRWLICACVTLY